MTIRIVDASAIGAFIFGEPDKPWVESQIGGFQLIAPSLLIFELGNICWKKLRRFPEQADVFLDAWNTWCRSDLVAAEDIDPVATILLARRHGLSFYDASYLWLAEHRKLDLISLDARLVRVARRLGRHAPSPGDSS